MPLYEFYCEPCHTVFTFRSRRVDTTTVPPCPVCGKPLRREVSAFAHILKGATAPETGNAGDSAAEHRLDQLSADMSNKVMDMDDDDAEPADAVRTMREMARRQGLHFKPDAEEALSRVEAGEDPEKLGEQFKEVFDSEDPFEADATAPGAGKMRALFRSLRPPRRDPVWHDMPSGDGDR